MKKIGEMTGYVKEIRRNVRVVHDGYGGAIGHTTGYPPAFATIAFAAGVVEIGCELWLEQAIGKTVRVTFEIEEPTP